MARKTGPRIALRRANSTGVGSMVPLVRPKGQVNTSMCPVCGARRGETCFVMTPTRFVELAETHTGLSARKGDVSPQARPQGPSQPGSRRSTPVLDARYAERKRREAASRKKVNGG